MMKEFLLGSTVALCVAGQASALSLTVTLLEDNRFIEAEAFAGEDFDFDEDSPSPAFSNFNSGVSASAMEFGNFIEDSDDLGYGASSFAGASQKSTVEATTILVSGSAFVEGSLGNPGAIFLSDSEDFIDSPDGSFEAYAESVLDILFSIDESAAYDIQAFLSAGIEPIEADGVLEGGEDSGAFNFAEMSLFNEGTDESVFEFEVSDGSMEIKEAGIIGPGTYRFTASAYAEVFGGFFEDDDSASDSDDTLQPIFGYQTNASFGGIGLSLVRADQPIPEPVTTSLIGLGLGALVLRTTRRRRA